MIFHDISRSLFCEPVKFGVLDFRTCFSKKPICVSHMALWSYGWWGMIDRPYGFCKIHPNIDVTEFHTACSTTTISYHILIPIYTNQIQSAIFFPSVKLSASENLINKAISRCKNLVKGCMELWWTLSSKAIKSHPWSDKSQPHQPHQPITFGSEVGTCSAAGRLDSSCEA